MPTDLTERDHVSQASLTHWRQLMAEPRALEDRVFRLISSGRFIHEVAYELGVPEDQLNAWLSTGEDRRGLWLDADHLGRSVIRSRLRSELSRMAFADLRKLYDEHGSLLSIHRWPDSEARSVDSIQIQSGVNKDGGEWENVKIKMESKLKAVELLGKEVGMFVDRKVVKVTSLEDVLAESWRPSDSEDDELESAEVVPKLGDGSAGGVEGASVASEEDETVGVVGSEYEVDPEGGEPKIVELLLGSEEGPAESEEKAIACWCESSDQVCDSCAESAGGFPPKEDPL